MNEDTPTTVRADLLRLTTEIAVAHVANNNMAASELSGLIRDIHGALVAVQQGEGPAEKLTPAVPARKSVKPDAIACLECGKSLRMLKRHLKTDHGLTPQEYRERWGLQSNYPMVAPNYARQRSDMAKKIGLGRKPDRSRSQKQGR